MKALLSRAVVSLSLLTILRASAATPSVATGNPTNITTNSATLNGTANPNGLATLAYFEWGTTTNYGSVTAPQSLGAGSSAVAVQANLASLLTDTNYHYRLVASNASGIAYGKDVIVTPTLLLFLYAGESWSYTFHDLPYYTLYLQPDTPRANCGLGFLPGSFAPGSTLRWELFVDATNQGAFYSQLVTQATGGYVAMYPSQVWLNDLQGAVRLTMLTGSVAVSSILFEQTAIHAGGVGTPEYGNTIVPTRTPQPPSFGTQFVNSVSVRSALISADINVKNISSGVFAQWGTTTNYGSASGVTTLNFDYFVRRDISLSNLAPDTLYHARFVATNSVGTNYGTDLTFKTLNNVITQPANNRTTTSAVLNASVTLDAAVTTSAYFQWGTTTNYGQVTSQQNLGTATTVSNISAPLAGLAPLSTYHFRAAAVSSSVTNFGSDLAFATTLPPTNSVITNLVTDDVRGAIARGGLVIFACDGVLVLSNQIEIANDVSLDASGHSITFSGGNTSRIFSVFSGVTAVISNLTLTGGRATDVGGAVYNQGDLSAYQCRFISNAVVAAAGIVGTNGLDGTNSPIQSQNTPGRPAGSGSDGSDAAGGAIYSMGNLTLTGCLFATNAALGGKGGAGGLGGRGGQSSIFNPFYFQPGGAGGMAARVEKHEAVLSPASG